ncbi:MAG TPA: TIGR03435 family protein, partial [Bryobacteraceae bacterium]|nr:TIGR03435 family protein [Bryobacteraceae bacterium]
MKRPLVCLLAALALDSPASGQSTAFEVVSIKPAPQNKRELQQHLGTQIDPAMVDFGGVSLLMLLTRAYGLHSFQVVGEPELNTTRFNIVAKLP